VCVSSRFGPVLIVHGGAGSLPSEEDRRLYLEGVTDALAAGMDLLGTSARAAVVAAVVHLESHSITNAGRGAALDEHGDVHLDAGFMDGTTRRYGGVTGVRIAEGLAADGEYGRFVAAPSSDDLIQLMGLEACDPTDLVTERTTRLYAERSKSAGTDSPLWLDTVGAVALDAEGHVAAAVSTGGMSLKRAGRVGDSPVVGAGFWAADGAGACVTTGVGEALMRQGTARRCVQLLEDGQPPARAAELALAELVDYEGDTRGASGLILVSASGVAVLDHNSKEMSSGWARPDGRSEVTHLWGPS
jgi:beta-aspartyl-peptidase (threonine type)